VSELQDEVDELPLSTRLSIADALTLGNAICGFMAVYFTTTGVLVPHLMGTDSGGVSKHSAANAVTLMLMASVFDLFDGLVARKLRSSAMGAELDNLSDLISFGLAPAYFVVVWGIVTEDAHGRVAAAAAVLVVLAVVLRLARFSCTTLRDGVFQGMPSPFGALTVVGLALSPAQLLAAGISRAYPLSAFEPDPAASMAHAGPLLERASAALARDLLT